MLLGIWFMGDTPRSRQPGVIPEHCTFSPEGFVAYQRQIKTVLEELQARVVRIENEQHDNYDATENGR